MAGSRAAWVLGAVLVGCTARSPLGATFVVVPRPDLANTVDLRATLDDPAAVTVVCAAPRPGADDDTLVYTSPRSREHAIPMRGLLADTAYACTLVTDDPVPRLFPFEAVTDPLPDGIPSVTVSRPDPAIPSTGPAFVVLGHDQHCVDGPPRLIVFDTDGEVRWYDEGIPSLDIAFDAGYLGAGVFSYGGGWHDDAPPTLLGVDHDDPYVVDSPNARSHTFHHDGRQLPTGDFLLMMHETIVDPLGGPTWGGFSVGLVTRGPTPGTDVDTFFWSAQQAVDAGDLGPGIDADPYHANWADYQPADPPGPAGDRLYVSMCKLGEVFAIDAASGAVAWAFGETRSDFALRYPDGTTPDAGVSWPQCQHGLEFLPFPGGGGGELLLYDNGSHGRGYSRLVSYLLDETTMTATLAWTWTEPEWSEPAWGDVDLLPDDHVQATMGHTCGSRYPDHLSAVVEVDRATGGVPWRLGFTDPLDAIYRSERVDACDVFPVARLCPAAAATAARVLGGGG